MTEQIVVFRVNRLVDDSSDVTDQTTDPLHVAFVVCVRVIRVLEPKETSSGPLVHPVMSSLVILTFLSRLVLQSLEPTLLVIQNKTISLIQCNSVNNGPIDTILAPLESSSHISTGYVPL